MSDYNNYNYLIYCERTNGKVATSDDRIRKKKTQTSRLQLEDSSARLYLGLLDNTVLIYSVLIALFFQS